MPVTRPIEERFWEKVKKTSGCWEWTAARNNRGYGMLGNSLGVKKKMILAHHVSFELANGKVPKGMWVLHRCDNPGCVNPAHLFLGDNTVNVNDMHRKGRGWGGIGPETAYAILWESRSGVPRKKICETYGVSLHVVKDIAARRSWLSLSSTMHD
jgi:hypothetical protein